MYNHHKYSEFFCSESSLHISFFFPKENYNGHLSNLTSSKHKILIFFMNNFLLKHWIYLKLLKFYHKLLKFFIISNLYLVMILKFLYIIFLNNVIYIISLIVIPKNIDNNVNYTCSKNSVKFLLIWYLIWTNHTNKIWFLAGG